MTRSNITEGPASISPPGEQLLAWEPIELTRAFRPRLRLAERLAALGLNQGVIVTTLGLPIAAAYNKATGLVGWERTELEKLDTAVPGLGIGAALAAYDAAATATMTSGGATTPEAAAKSEEIAPPEPASLDEPHAPRPEELADIFVSELVVGDPPHLVDHPVGAKSTFPQERMWETIHRLNVELARTKDERDLANRAAADHLAEGTRLLAELEDARELQEQTQHELTGVLEKLTGLRAQLAEARDDMVNAERAWREAERAAHLAAESSPPPPVPVVGAADE